MHFKLIWFRALKSSRGIVYKIQTIWTFYHANDIKYNVMRIQRLFERVPEPKSLFGDVNLILMSLLTDCTPTCMYTYKCIVCILLTWMRHTPLKLSLYYPTLRTRWLVLWFSPPSSLPSTPYEVLSFICYGMQSTTDESGPNIHIRITLCSMFIHVTLSTIYMCMW